jgi:uncharacterized membrane protein YdjX (TVP38/TMEM64 family)
MSGRIHVYSTKQPVSRQVLSYRRICANIRQRICMEPTAMEENIGIKQERPKGLKRLIAFILFAAVAVCITVLTPVGDYLNVESITEIAGRLGYWGPVIILVIGTFSPLLFFPRWPVAVVSGLLYGILWGALLANVASTLGALLHFYLAKNLLAPMADRIRAKFPFAANSISRNKAFAALFFFRAFPLSNFVATNLVAGALKIPLGTYLLATFLGMIPSSLMYASCGKLMKKPSPAYYYLTMGIVLAIILATALAQKHVLAWFKRTRDESGEK